MFIKTFKFRIVGRVLSLAATLTLLAALMTRADLPFVTIGVALLGVYQVYALIRFVEKANRDLSRFLRSIKYDDTSQVFTSDGLGSSFSELNEAFNQVIRKLQESRSDMAVHANYLNTIIQHVGIGLLAYKPDGTIILANNAAKKLLKVAGLININSLRPTSPELIDALLCLKHGEKKLIKIQGEGETGYLSIFARTFLLREEKYTLASLQNIQAELEEKEMEAWHNLIKVLTHEMMNSITPISSMTATLLDLLDTSERNESAADGLGREEIKEISAALKTIHQRSQGLMNFVDSYRNMTFIPKPEFKLLSLSDFLKRIEKLMKSRLADSRISFRWSVEPESLELTADPDLIEQVMLNLLLNSIDAVAGRDNPCITISASLSPEGKVTIVVADNGVGIVADALEKIFIPFFTTKKRGSGIGLSLSRQILRLHNSTISAKSAPDEGSAFTLRFH
jgi:signal transduction histidine kinase